MTSIAAVIVLTYLVFIYFSESLNPFRKPRLQMNRNQWRYGRRMALAALAGGLCAAFFFETGLMSLHTAVASGGVVGLVLGLGFSAGRISNSLRG